MELKMNAYQLPENITFNYEQLKNELREKVSMYETLVYDDTQISEAKKDKANLNKLKKALNDERIRLEREYLQPFNDFKAKINEIIGIIDKPVQVIDRQVKEFEEVKRTKKQEEIKAIFEKIGFPDFVTLEKIFDSKWLNSSVSLKSIQGAMEVFKEQTEKDLSTLSNMPEFGFEAVEVYKTTLDINKALNEGKRLSEIQKKKAEHETEIERQKAEREAELERKKSAQQEEQLPGQIGFTDTKSFEQCINPPVVEREWVGFKALLTAEDAAELSLFFHERGIEIEPINID